MKRPLHLVVLAVGLILAGGMFAGSLLTAQEKNPPKKPAAKGPPTQPTTPAKGEPLSPKPLSPDEQAILKAGDTYIAAFQKRDAKAMADCFTEDAEVTLAGGAVLVGRTAIAEALAENLANKKDATLTLSVDSLRIKASGIAIEHGVSYEARPGVPPEAMGYTAAYAKEGGTWKIASLFQSPPPQAPAAGDLLMSELGWLIGDWSSSSGKGARIVRSRFEWAQGGQFILGRHQVETDGATAQSGMEVIGWDPAAGRFRSWSFDAEGGFGEGLWSNEGPRWSVASRGTLPSGELTQTTYLFTKIDGRTLELKAVNRTVNGRIAPSPAAVKLFREAVLPQ